MGNGFALLRTALLGVEESARMVADGHCDDPVAAAAVTVAAGPRIVEGSGARARATLARYLARMGGRATPFGLFAGTAVADVGDERSLVLGPRSEHTARVRVDVEALRALVAEAVEAAPVADVPLRVNPTLHRDGAAMRFTRPGDSTADVVTMRSTPALREVVEALADAPATGAELARLLGATRPGADPAQLAGFVARLVDSSALLPAVDLIEPGVEPADRALEVLDRIGDRERAAALRALLDAACGRLPLPGLTDRLAAAWAPAAAAVAAWREVEVPHRFHVELQVSAPDPVLDRGTVDDLEQAVLRLVAMSSGRHELDAVREAFVQRYEDAEVPLLRALDLESGVVAPGPRGASMLAGSAGVRVADTADPPRVDPRRLELLDRFLRDGGPVDIADLPVAERSPVRSVQAALLDRHEGRYRSLLVGGAGRAPFALLARFALDRPQLRRRMLDWLADERPGADGEPDPIRAELVYHPAHRIANVLVRPRLTTETIGIGAAAGTLALDRLLLRVQGNRFALRDAVTGRPVQVELNTAHNVDMPGQDPLYSFLGHLSSPGGAAWSWGALDRLSHLPRVTCGSVIVAPERWRVERAAVRALLDGPRPADALRALLPGIGGRRWVGSGVYDNILPVDLHADASVTAALARAATGPGALDIVEMPQLESPAVTGPDGGHVAEVILPVHPPAAARARPVPAVFDPAHGERWVYFRFHCGYAAADTVIRGAAELAGRLRADGAATAWFFLRYGADGHHVRVRVRPADGHRDTVVRELAALGRALRADDAVVSRVVMDDYVPELGRYGGAAGLAAAEELFSADSDRVAAVIAAGTGERERLYQAVADMVEWCEVLFPGEGSAAQDFLAAGAAGQGLSFRAEGNRHGRFHREHRGALEEFVASAASDPQVAARLAALAAAVRGRLPPERVGSVLGSALHLHCNRLFTFDANRLEFLAYELARRTLRGRAARRRHDRAREVVRHSTAGGTAAGAACRVGGHGRARDERREEWA